MKRDIEWTKYIPESTRSKFVDLNHWRPRTLKIAELLLLRARPYPIGHPKREEFLEEPLTGLSREERDFLVASSGRFTDGERRAALGRIRWRLKQRVTEEDLACLRQEFDVAFSSMLRPNGGRPKRKGVEPWLPSEWGWELLPFVLKWHLRQQAKVRAQEILVPAVSCPVDIDGNRIGRQPGRRSSHVAAFDEANDVAADYDRDGDLIWNQKDEVPFAKRGAPMAPDFGPALDRLVERIDQGQPLFEEDRLVQLPEILEALDELYTRWEQTGTFEDALSFSRTHRHFVKGVPGLPLKWNIALVARLRVEALIGLGEVFGFEYWFQALDLARKHLPRERVKIARYMLDRMIQMENDPRVRQADLRAEVRQASDESTRQLARRLKTSKSEVARIRAELKAEQSPEI